VRVNAPCGATTRSIRSLILTPPFRTEPGGKSRGQDRVHKGYKFSPGVGRRPRPQKPQPPQEVATFCFGVAFASVCGSPPQHPVEPHVPFV